MKTYLNLKKMKQLIILIFFLSLSSLTIGQENYKLTFSTDKKVGEEIKISIHADTNVRPQIWIDLNNNGIRDVDEEVKKFASGKELTPHHILWGHRQ